jgi:hypothetical protein
MRNGFKPCVVSHANKKFKRTVDLQATALERAWARESGEQILDMICSSRKSRMNAYGTQFVV